MTILLACWKVVQRCLGRKLEWSELERGQTEAGEEVLRARLKFEKQEDVTRHHIISRILSLGFIKNIPVKISLYTALIFALAYIT